jgi:hypothetical protein
MNEILPGFAMLLDTEEAAEYEVQGDPPKNALALLQSVYRNSDHPLSVRLRAAIGALPYENPRLSAVALGSLNGEDFASQLDRAIERSDKAPLMINARPLNSCKL